MSQMNIQNLLNIGPVQPDVSPIVGQPEYQSSQFVGGGFQMGQPTKQIGPSDEEAMYSSLAQIAGGVQKGIDIFSDIRSRIEKEEINKAEVEFEKLDADETLLPEDKYDKFEQVVEKINTPLLGSTWREKFSTQAQKRWLSSEALNKFEEERYTKEFSNYLSRSRNRGRAVTPELIQAFNLEYASRYPLSEYNSWFVIKNAETNTQVIKTKIEDALASLGPSIDAAIPVPDEAGQQGILTGNAEVMNKFQVFIEEMDRARLSNFEEYRDHLLRKVQKEAIPENLPPEAMIEIAKRLPEAVNAKAKQIWSLATEFSVIKTQEGYNASLATAKNGLIGGANSDISVRNYLDTMVRVLPHSTYSLTQQRDEVMGSLSSIYQSIQASSDTESKIPNWTSMLPHEQLAVAEAKLVEWLNTEVPGNKTNADLVFGMMKYTPDELKNIPQSVEDRRKYIAQTLINQGRIATYASKDFNDKLGNAFAEKTNGLISQSSVIGVVENPSSLYSNQVNISAEFLGVSPESFQKLYYKEGSFTDVNIERWFNKDLNDTEREELRKRGFNLELNKGNILKLAEAAKKFRIEVSELVLKGAQEKPEGMDTITKQAANFNMTSSGFSNPSVNGPYATGVIDGSLFKVEGNRELKQLMSVYRINKTKQREAAIKLEKGQKINAEDQAAIAFVSQTEQQYPWIENANKVMDREVYALTQSIPSLVTSLPKTGQESTGELQGRVLTSVESLNKKFEETISGRNSVDFSTSLSNAINPDGTWSEDAIYNFAVLKRKTNLLLQPNVSVGDRKWLTETLDSVLTRLNGGPAYLASPQGKYDLTVLALLGREYKAVSNTTGQSIVVPGTNAFNVRFSLLGNWSEETDISSMLSSLEANRGKIEANMIIPIAMASRQVNMRNVGSTLTAPIYETISEIYKRNNRAMVVGSALTSQARKEQLSTGGFKDVSNIPPSNMEWNPDKLREVLQDTLGESVSLEQLADAMDVYFLAGVVNPEVRSTLTPEEKVRWGAVLLDSATGENRNIMMDSLDLYFSDYGIDNENVVVGYGDTKLDLFFKFVDTSFDIDSRYVVANNQRLGISPINRVWTYGGVKVQDGVRIPVFENTTTVLNSTPESSWSNQSYSKLALSIINEGGINETKEMLAKKYPPAISKPDTEGRVTTQDGNNWFMGSSVLNGPPPSDVRTRFSLVETWANEHGVTPEVVFGLGGKSNAAAMALKSTLTKKFDSTFDFLKELDSTYTALGGDRPLINGSKFKPKASGFATLEQRSERPLRNAALPTWSWSNVSLRGIPYITLTDGYVMDEDVVNFYKKVSRESIKIPTKAAAPFTYFPTGY